MSLCESILLHNMPHCLRTCLKSNTFLVNNNNSRSSSSSSSSSRNRNDTTNKSKKEIQTTRRNSYPFHFKSIFSRTSSISFNVNLFKLLLISLTIISPTCSLSIPAHLSSSTIYEHINSSSRAGSALDEDERLLQSPQTIYQQMLAAAAFQQQQHQHQQHQPIYPHPFLTDTDDRVGGFNFMSAAPVAESFKIVGQNGKPSSRYLNGNIQQLLSQQDHAAAAAALLNENLIDIDQTAVTGHLDQLGPQHHHHHQQHQQQHLYQTSPSNHHLKDYHQIHQQAASSVFTPLPIMHSQASPYPAYGRHRQRANLNHNHHNNANNSSLAINQLLNFIDQTLPFNENLKSPSKMHNQRQQQHYHHHNHHNGRLPHHNQRQTIQNNSKQQQQSAARSKSHHLNGLANDFNNKVHQPSQHQQPQQQLGNSSSSSSSSGGGGGGVGVGISNNNNGHSEKLNGALTSSSLSNPKIPHDADNEMIATYNAPRCDKFTPDICVDDFEYPEQAILDEIHKKKDVFDLMYSEVKDNEPLVDGIPRDVEESYNYAIYQQQQQQQQQQQSNNGFNSVDFNSTSASFSSLSYISKDKDKDKDPFVGSGSSQMQGAGSSASSSGQTGNSQQGGFVCPSEVMYGKPKLAKNKKGLWKVIVNAGEYTQTVRLEKCLLPNKKCQYVSAQSFESRCAQVHSYNRLLVFEKNRGFYIDTFRLPTGCNCHVQRKSPMAALQQETKSPAGAAAASNAAAHQTSAAGGSVSTLSHTLWSILNKGANDGALMPHSDQSMRTQSAILDHLNQNPELAANISESVLKQLLISQHVFNSLQNDAAA